MASLVYDNWLKLDGDGTVDWDNGGHTYRLLLVGSLYVPSAAHVFVSEVTDELVGGGYSRKDIINRSIVVDGVNHWADYKADNVTWATLSGMVAGAVVYKFVTNDADSQLAFFHELTDINPGGVGYSIQWNGAANNGAVYRKKQAA